MNLQLNKDKILSTLIPDELQLTKDTFETALADLYRAMEIKDKKPYTRNIKYLQFHFKYFMNTNEKLSEYLRRNPKYLKKGKSVYEKQLKKEAKEAVKEAARIEKYFKRFEKTYGISDRAEAEKLDMLFRHLSRNDDEVREEAKKYGIDADNGEEFRQKLQGRHKRELAKQRRLARKMAQVQVEVGVDEDEYYAGLDDEFLPDESEYCAGLEDEYTEQPITSKENEQVIEDGETASKVFSFKDIEILATAILSKSLYYCPVDTGYLRNSVRLIRAGQGFIIKYFADYAPYVHECEYHHDMPTQNKFLEDAAIEALEDLELAYGNEIPLPEVRILYAPLTLFINVNTDQGNLVLDERYSAPMRNWKTGFVSPFDMRNRFLNKTEDENQLQSMLNLTENWDKLSHKQKMSEESANLFTYLAFGRYAGRIQ